MKVLVTGAAGFVGAHLCQRLRLGDLVQCVGVDNFNSYYEPVLKRARVGHMLKETMCYEANIADADKINNIFEVERPDIVVHLAAQAGVRHSFKDPMSYATSNLMGQVSVLEAVRKTNSVKRLIYASSSSVYSGNQTLPFHEELDLGTPKSLYAATKIAGEVLVDTYSRLHNLDAIGLRFFTVYGPWGRPDMAYWLFANAITNLKPIRLFNYGNIRRDFTYIDDITAAMVRMVEEVAGGGPNMASHEVYNIGNHSPEPVQKMIEILENLLGQKASVELEALPPGDMVETYASTEKLRQRYDFSPDTPLEIGLARFVDWYKEWDAKKFSLAERHSAIL